MDKSTWLKPLTYGLVFLLGPFVIYSLVYVQAREDSLIGRYYSHLTNISDRTEARFNSVSSVISSACRGLDKFPERIDKLRERIESSDLGLTFGSSDEDSERTAVREGCVAARRDQSERLATFISQQRLQFSIKGGSAGTDTESNTAGASAIGALTIFVNPRLLVFAMAAT